MTITATLHWLTPEWLNECRSRIHLGGTVWASRNWTALFPENGRCE